MDSQSRVGSTKCMGVEELELPSRHTEQGGVEREGANIRKKVEIFSVPFAFGKLELLLAVEMNPPHIIFGQLPSNAFCHSGHSRV